MGRSYFRKLAKEDAAGILSALDHARQALDRGDVDCGWKHLQAAERLKLMCAGHAEVKAVAVVIRAEADKLNAWRKRASQDLLLIDSDHPYDRHRVLQAALVRDEHYNNQAHKDAIRRHLAEWLAVALFVGLVALLILAGFGMLDRILPPPAAGVARPDHFAAIIVMAVMGVLGAAFSAAISVGPPDGKSRIPETLYSTQVTWLRLLIGPVSAIVAYFAIQSNLYKEVLSLPRPEGFALLLVGFGFGFSERWVLRLVEAVVGKDAG